MVFILEVVEKCVLYLLLILHPLSSYAPSIPLLCLSFPLCVCSSSLEEDLTVGCNAGCSCVRELYNPVCGADGVMYYSPCHAGCSSINHTEHSSGKQVQYTVVTHTYRFTII